jgi:hypothetical protein
LDIAVIIFLKALRKYEKDMNRNILIEKIIDDNFILIKLIGKQPTENGWQNRTESIKASEFGPDDNVGLVLGGASEIVDIDIDSLRAIGFAELFPPN